MKKNFEYLPIILRQSARESNGNSIFNLLQELHIPSFFFLIFKRSVKWRELSWERRGSLTAVQVTVGERNVSDAHGLLVLYVLFVIVVFFLHSRANCTEDIIASVDPRKKKVFYCPFPSDLSLLKCVYRSWAIRGNLVLSNGSIKGEVPQWKSWKADVSSVNPSSDFTLSPEAEL